jgi:hypothetical protein
LPNLLDVLSGLTNPDDAPRSGIIAGVNTDGTVDLSYLGGIVTNVPVVSTYTPTSGDVVQIMRRGTASLLVLGAVRTSNTGGGTVSADFVVSYNVDAVPSAITGGGTAGSTGVLSVIPYTAGSYRRTDGWAKSDVRQGVYYSSTQLGYYHGAWFYGVNAFSQLKGRTITRVRIYLSRDSSGGVFAAEPIHIYRHKNATKPSGDVYFFGSQVSAPKLAVSSSGIFDLPISVGQELASGYAKGLGLLHNGTSDYLILNGLSSYANSGRLDISWRED